jgi:hypothetical protein
LRASLAFLLPDGWRGEVVDLSATGLRIQCLALLTPQAIIEGTLVVDAKTSVKLRGVVVWTSPPDHRGFVPAEFGLELLEVPQAYLDALAGLFAEQG